MLRRQNLARKMFSIQRSRFTDEQIALILQQGSKKMQVMNNSPEIAYFLPESPLITGALKTADMISISSYSLCGGNDFRRR